MRREGITVREAAEGWVREMFAIPRGMIRELMMAEPDKWREVTKPTAGNRVHVYEVPQEVNTLEHSGEIRSYDEESGLYCIELDDGKLVSAEAEDFEVVRDSLLPMCGTMWAFVDVADNLWLETEGGILAMSECGFRIYESEQFGLIFGIDVTRYDFYEAHWIPLYRARGLRRHDAETEQEDD